MSWEEDCVQLAQHTVDWFWAEFSADAYFSSAPDEVPPLQDHILWFALPTDRAGIRSNDGVPGYVVEKLLKAAEWLRNASGEIDKVATGDLMVDWEGDAAEKVKTYISSVKTSCEHLVHYIDGLLVAAKAHGDRLYAIEDDVVAAIGMAKKAVKEGNDTSGDVATAIAGAVLAVPTGGTGAVAVSVVSSALTAEVAKFVQTFTGDGVYATRELKESLGKLRNRFAAATESVGNALNGLANEVSQARIPAEVDLPRVVQDRAFDPSQFCIDDPNYSYKEVSTEPLLPKKELVPGTEEERDEKQRGEAGQERQRGREDARPKSDPNSAS